MCMYSAKAENDIVSQDEKKYLEILRVRVKRECLESVMTPPAPCLLTKVLQQIHNVGQEVIAE